MRKRLLALMEENIAAGNDCTECHAPCCTFAHNSMRIDQHEARTIVDYLRSLPAESQSRFRAALRDTVRSYGLDRETSLRGGSAHLLRKTYTCTFFGDAPLGCTLPFSHKPLGCIAFNPLEAAQTEGGKCGHLMPPHDYLDAAVVRKPIPLAVLEAWGAEQI